jgi:aminoglycoside phosphotransferase family enzyme/predicted kinase
MADSDLPKHIEALLLPDAYPHAAKQIELRQTHISYVFIVDDVVYKLKKPLDFGFLDYSTLEKRKHFCEQEVILNRRMCEETYLDVVPIVSSGNAIKLGGEGEVLDYAVKMRRLPEERMMSNLLDRDDVVSPMIAALAERIASFHMTSERNAEIDQYGGLETVRHNWRENFEQTESYIGRTLTHSQFDTIRAFVDGVLGADQALFAQRVQEGRARDCHGDMRTDAVCFEEKGVCIYDCIEFQDRFRYSDVASDIAFLAMDLEFRGRRDISDELLGRYLSHTLDSTLPLLLPFYKCYRAFVRGKVDGFQLDQPEISDEQKAQVTAAAQRYFDLAELYTTQQAQDTLIITIGVTGSGKSYLANALAAHIGAVVLSSDVVRKRMLGLDPTERHEEEWGTGIYTPETTERTYEALIDEARPWLQQGKAVVLDASFLYRWQRRLAQMLAGEANVGFLALQCDADDETVWQRLSERKGDKRVVSDGRWEVYQQQQERREPIEALGIGTHAVFDTTRRLAEQLAEVDEHLAALKTNA